MREDLSALRTFADRIAKERAARLGKPAEHISVEKLLAMAARSGAINAAIVVNDVLGEVDLADPQPLQPLLMVKVRARAVDEARGRKRLEKLVERLVAESTVESAATPSAGGDIGTAKALDDAREHVLRISAAVGLVEKYRADCARQNRRPNPEAEAELKDYEHQMLTTGTFVGTLSRGARQKIIRKYEQLRAFFSYVAATAALLLWRVRRALAWIVASRIALPIAGVVAVVVVALLLDRCPPKPGHGGPAARAARPTTQVRAAPSIGSARSSPSHVAAPARGGAAAANEFRTAPPTSTAPTSNDGAARAGTPNGRTDRTLDPAPWNAIAARAGELQLPGYKHSRALTLSFQPDGTLGASASDVWCDGVWDGSYMLMKCNPLRHQATGGDPTTEELLLGAREESACGLRGSAWILDDNNRLMPESWSIGCKGRAVPFTRIHWDISTPATIASELCRAHLAAAVCQRRFIDVVLEQSDVDEVTARGSDPAWSGETCLAPMASESGELVMVRNSDWRCGTRMISLTPRRTDATIYAAGERSEQAWLLGARYDKKGGRWLPAGSNLSNCIREGLTASSCLSP